MPRPTALVPVPGLRDCRVNQLLTQRQLADRAGLALSVIGRLEAGAEARFSTVLKLAAALGVEPAQLLRQPATGRPPLRYVAEDTTDYGAGPAPDTSP